MNPFIYNFPVLNTDFYDRKTLIKNVLTETILGKTQGDVWITGERKTGKTSFLNYLLNNYDNYVGKEIKVYGSNQKFKPLFCLANVQYCKCEDEFYNELWQSIKNDLDFKIKRAPSAEENFINAIQFAYNNKFFPVFLVDEFDAFLEVLAIEEPKLVRHFVNKLNSFLTNILDVSHKVFSCIFTSNHDFIDLNSKYDLQITGSGIIAEIYEIEWFTETQLKGLAKHYLKNNEIQFSDDELSTIYKYTKGYPYFTQKILSQLYDLKEEQETKTIKKTQLKDIAKTEFETTINFWIGQNMPIRTYNKLKELLNGIGGKLFDTALKLLFEYSKSKF